LACLGRIKRVSIMEELKIALYLVGFFALLFLTYVTTKYIGQKQMKTMKSKNISVVETIMLGADKRLHLVRAGNSYVLIASTSKTIEFLTTVDLDENEISEETKDNTDLRFDFRSILEKYSGIYKAKKQNTAVPGDTQVNADRQETGFRTNLNRLKAIVNKDRFSEVKKDGVEVTNDK
jgi:flagellar protein FliO/FliZ